MGFLRTLATGTGSLSKFGLGNDPSFMTYFSSSAVEHHRISHLVQGLNHVDIKHLMTGPKGNSEFCFPETLNVPRGEAEGNIEVEGKQNSLFPEGPVITM